MRPQDSRRPHGSDRDHPSSSIIVVIALFLVSLYNGLVTQRNRIDEALGQIEVQLKRRHDLIPNLIAAVKGYMGFEQSVLTQVTEARANAVAAGAQGPAAAGRRRERPDLVPALAVRGRRELPGPQGERERHAPPGGADDDREPDQLLAPALQRDGPGLQQRDPDVPGRADRRPVRLPQARVLRRRARGATRSRTSTSASADPAGDATDPARHRPSPERVPWPHLLRPDRAEQAQLGPARRSSSSSSSGVLGLSIGWARHRRPAGGAPVARHRDRPRAGRVAVARTTLGDSLVLAVSGAKEIDEQASRSCTTSSRRWRSRPTCRCPRST